jgi:hypothetical protein
MCSFFRPMFGSVSFRLGIPANFRILQESFEKYSTRDTPADGCIGPSRGQKSDS